MKKVLLIAIFIILMGLLFLNPVSAALDDSFSDHLLHFDGGIIDESGDIWLNHASTIDTSIYKFGNGALSGSNTQYIYSSSSMSTYNHSSADFTIEAWVYFVSGPTGPTYVYQVFANASNNEQLVVGNTGTILYTYVTSGTNRGNFGTTTGVVSSGVWSHIAIVRSGANAKIFLNGVSQSLSVTTAFNGNLDISGAGSPNVRIGQVSGYSSSEKVDEFRLSHIARWTTDFTPNIESYGGISPPSSQYNLQFYVQDSTTRLPMQGASVVLDGRASSLPIYSSTTDVYGYYNVTGVTGGTYILTVGKTGYDSKTGTIVVGQNQLYSSYLTPTGYITGAGLSYNVMDAINQTPITGALITLDGRESGLPFYTNTTYNGSGYILNVPNGNYLQSVSKAGYETKSGTVPISGSQFFNTYLIPLTNYGTGANPVQFLVRDATTQLGIPSAHVIAIGEVSGGVYQGDTDITGAVTLNMDSDYYRLVYSAVGYNPVDDGYYTTYITSGQTITKYLYPTSTMLNHTATFTVLDITPPNNPVSFSRIWLQKNVMTPVYGGITDDSGVITITNVPTDTYSVWAYDANNSYNDYTGSIVVTGDISATIYLIPRNWSGIPTPTTPMAYPTWTPPASFTPIPTIPGSGPGGVPANLKEMALNFMMGFIGVDPTQASFLIGLVICFACTGILGGISMNPGLALVGAGIGTMAAWGMGFWPPYVIIIMILLCAVGLFLFKGGGGEPG